MRVVPYPAGETRGIDWIRHAIQIGFAIFFVSLAAKWFPKKVSNNSAPPPGATTGYPTSQRPT